MALLWIDGFDHYAANGGTLQSLAGIGGNYNVDVNVWTAATMPVLGGLGLRENQSNTDPSGFNHPLPSTYGTGNTIGMGAHIYVNSYVNSDVSRGQSIFHLLSAAGVGIIYLNMLSSGQLQVRAGSVIGSSLADSGTNLLSQDVAYHIEMKVGLHASTGTIEVRVNGVVWINATGLNTLQSQTVGQVGLGAGNYASGQSVDMYWDNFYIWDGTGSVNNDFVGECVVETLFPNADTADADWTKSSGSDGYNLINDVPANISNYIEAANVGDESIFECTNLSTTAYSIKGVMAAVNAQKTTAGASTIEIGVETNNVQSMSAGQALTQGSLTYRNHVVQLNPDTGVAWTPSEVNAIQVVVDRAA